MLFPSLNTFTTVNILQHWQGAWKIAYMTPFVRQASGEESELHQGGGL